MNILPTWAKEIGDWVVWLVGIASALAYVRATISKPIEVIKEDTAVLLWNSLTREHDDFIRKGYCPRADKERLVAMHERYRKRGRNHLADTFEQDILSLPDAPEGAETEV